MSEYGQTAAVPSTLGAIAAEKWAEFRQLLMNDSPASLTRLEIYCVNYERWRQAQEWLAEHGDVLEIVSDKGVVIKVQPAPKLDVAARAEKTMTEMMSKLRLSAT